MSRKYRLSTALDVDDLLMECTAYAIRLANEKYGFDPPMTIYEKETWGHLGTRVDTIYQYFSDPEFYRTQPVYEGAREFVRKLAFVPSGSWRNSLKFRRITFIWAPGRIRSTPIFSLMMLCTTFSVRRPNIPS